MAEEEVGSLCSPRDGLLISSLRYNEIFFMIDTCQATTMYSKFYSPNILATGSSQLAENSYSVNNVPTNIPNGADPYVTSTKTIGTLGFL